MTEYPDPPEHERMYFRHATTGDLGWLVRRDGKDYIKLDRPSQDIVKPFRDHEWVQEREHRPLTRLQLAQVAFEADKRLCFFLGKHELARREWLNQKEEDRIAWGQRGPSDIAARRELYVAIMDVLAKYAGR